MKLHVLMSVVQTRQNAFVEQIIVLFSHDYECNQPKVFCLLFKWWNKMSAS